MAKIKMTKTELKAQQDALKQFLRFLPWRGVVFRNLSG